jgi:hypothetical protein
VNPSGILVIDWMYLLQFYNILASSFMKLLYPTMIIITMENKSFSAMMHASM